MTQTPSAVAQELAVFGFSEVEARVYEYLAKGGAQSVLYLSKMLELPRTSVYDAVYKLAERGMIEQVMQYKKTLYKAAPVGTLQTLILERQKKVADMEDSLAHLTAALSAKTPDVVKTEVRYYKGVQGLRQMMWNSLKADAIVGYSVMGRADIVGKPFYAKYVAEVAKRGIRDRVIINPSEHSLRFVYKSVVPLTHHITRDDIRVMPEDKLYVSGDTMIYNDVYAQCYWLKGEVVGVEIENAEFVRSQKDIFTLLWERAERLPRVQKTR